jgi:predicted MFS family arabinose efflux permease
MALAGNWPVAAGLILAERIGRAIRKPTVEAMLSHTTGQLGKGWVYGLNTALDETGATVGPLLVALLLYLSGGESYRGAFAVLLGPALLAIISLAVARFFFRVPSRLEAGPVAKSKGFTRAYWLYMLAAACFAAGLMSFELISFHFSNTGTVTRQWIPLFLAISTGVGVIANLVFGRLYDRIGLPIVLVAVAISSLFAPFIFLGGFFVALAGMILWGIGYAAQDTLFKAIVAGQLPDKQRNLAFGLFYAGYGCGWLIGSVTTGLLYDRSRPLLIAFSIAVQLASMPLFLLAHRQERHTQRT